MKKLIILIVLYTISTVTAKGIDSQIDSLLRVVDQVVAQKEQYTSERVSRMEETRSRADALQPGEEKFNTLVDLMHQYAYFNTDSAYKVLVQMEELARAAGDSALIESTMVERANLMTQIAMYPEALKLIRTVNKNKLPESFLPSYFHVLRTLYGRMHDYAVYDEEKKEYETITLNYIDSIMSVNTPGSFAYTLALADKLNIESEPAQAIELLNRCEAENRLSDHERAMLTWTRSESYRLLGNKNARKLDLIYASIGDLKSGVREYISLRELAAMLNEDGDLDRAYRYMNIAMEDAVACNARQRIVELNSLYPVVNGIYIDKINSQKHALAWTIGIISVLAVVLFGLFLYTRSQKKKVSEARKTLHEAYQELDKLNGELQEANKSLSQANKDIEEISKLKEVYIGKYMDQCLVYIDKLDMFRKSAVKMLNQNKTDELKRIMKSSSGVNDELRNFYSLFDTTFLSLYPSFIRDINNLLREEEAIIPKHEGELTPELRILALIKLGFNDSERIASFLQYSLTTIYNYRTRLRNKAKGDREKFEEEVKKLGM